MTDNNQVKVFNIFQNILNEGKSINIPIINIDKKMFYLNIISLPKNFSVSIHNQFREFIRTLFFEKDTKISDIIQKCKLLKFCNNKYCSKLSDDVEFIDGFCPLCYYIENCTDTLDSDCSICLEPNNLKSFSTSCKHFFHKSCIDKCQKQYDEDGFHIRCPMCRKDLVFYDNAERNECVKDDYDDDDE